jgi:hypothetical protein
MKNHLKTEFEKAFSKNKTLWYLVIIFIPTTIQFLFISSGFIFYRGVEVHTGTIGGVISLLFPIFFIILYSNSFLIELKNGSLNYLKCKTEWSNYFIAKGVVNCIVTFMVAFAMIFISFVFIIYIEPSLNIIQYDSYGSGYFRSIGTFEILLSYGILFYGFVYSFWVAINAVLYSTLAYVLTLVIKRSVLAISLPFVWYFLINIVAGVLGYESFSTISTIFPFNIEEQPLWTVLVPFSFNLFILSLLILHAKSTFKENLPDKIEFSH